MPVVRTDGRSVGRSVGQAYGHVITKISRMGRLHHFFRYGAALAAWSSAMNTYLLRNSPLRERRGAASLRYGNRAEFTILVCGRRPYPVWFSCRRESYPV